MVSKLFMKLCPFFLNLASETVTFVDDKGKFLVTLQLNMPSHLWSTLIPRYQAAFPGHLQVANTASKEEANVSLGEAIHFS